MLGRIVSWGRAFGLKRRPAEVEPEPETPSECPKCGGVIELVGDEYVCDGYRSKAEFLERRRPDVSERRLARLAEILPDDPQKLRSRCTDECLERAKRDIPCTEHGSLGPCGWRGKADDFGTTWR